ncbi:MAG: peptide ABC transporter substrate-binding protein [Lactobacillus sp.]|jgi:oligopeptide transport system substrate-binding protein|nr:peptide ABC transporter substrate-binding protein [Lactobacillus sp.]MCI1974241.1 peptide ABC transporter substrate-binding protein [Lactobacillus sp.]
MKLRKLTGAAAIIAASGFILAGCGNNNSSSSKQDLTWMAKTELESMDISKATDATSFDQLNNAIEGFYRLGKNSKVEPGIAKKTKISKDGKHWTFILRKNAKWSNGDKVTAKDFVYSWRRTVDPKTGSQYSYLFSGIKNADDIVAGKKAVKTLGIKADGNYKVEVNLEKRIPYFKLLMGFPLFGPQNEKVVKKYGKNYGNSSKAMVYNGPFKQTGWTGTNLSWKLKKNPYYWDKKAVKLNTINYSVQKTPSTDYNLYQSGKLDAALLDPQAAKSLKGKSGYTIRKASSSIYLELNQKKAAFKNENLRKAISLSINRTELAKSIGGAAKPLTTFDPQGIAQAKGKDFTELVKGTETKKFDSYNPAEAKTYWAKAKKELGKKSLSFTILSYDDDASKKGAEFIQSAIETHLKGINVRVQSIPKKAALARGEKGNFDVFLAGWNADFSDPISFLDLHTTGNSYNRGSYSNTEYDKLVAASKTTGSTNQRWDDLAKAEKVLISTQGITPLYQPAEAWMIRPNVKGVIYNGAGSNLNFKTAYIK